MKDRLSVSFVERSHGFMVEDLALVSYNQCKEYQESSSGVG